MNRELTYPRLVRLSRIMLIPVVLVMLFFGLQQIGYDGSNHLHWNNEKKGYTFTHNSIAFTDLGFVLPASKDSFTIELQLEPDYQTYPSFQFILLLYGRGSSDQLVIGQWDRSLVVMKGRDFSNRRHEPKVYVPLGDENGVKRVRIVARGDRGVSVFVNDVPAGESRHLHLQPPDSPGSLRLVLGNSISARNPWYGTLYSLSFGVGEDVKDGYAYDFTHAVSGEILEVKGRGPSIKLPGEIPVLHKRILLWPDLARVKNVFMLVDILINFLGFIPLGFLLPLCLPGERKARRISPMLVSLGLIFLFSLFIEVSQIYLPARHSSLLDLVLNTGGGLLGILLALRYISKRQKFV